VVEVYQRKNRKSTRGSNYTRANKPVITLGTLLFYLGVCLVQPIAFLVPSGCSRGWHSDCQCPAQPPWERDGARSSAALVRCYLQIFLSYQGLGELMRITLHNKAYLERRLVLHNPFSNSTCLLRHKSADFVVDIRNERHL